MIICFTFLIQGGYAFCCVDILNSIILDIQDLLQLHEVFDHKDK